MILTDLSLTNFKNIREASLDFSPNINALLGNNAMGKSNLLDAIYYLSLGKSHTGGLDASAITRGETFTTIRARYRRRGTVEELTLGITPGRPKSFKRQGKAIRRLSEHIGQFPIVLVAPRDIDLVAGQPDDRRRFIDMIISQTDPVYLDRLIRYSEALKQRNRLLRDGSDDTTLFEALELTLERNGEAIASTRAAFVKRFDTMFAGHYASITDIDEPAGIIYHTQLADDTRPLADRLAANRTRDAIIGYTTVGPHRDDLELTVTGAPVRTAASQGQQKTFTIAMRLTQYDFMAETMGMKPLLLLDDIFDKLDAGRVARIVDTVSSSRFGQIFITDTNRDHLDSIMAGSGNDYRLWHVNDGKFSIQ